MFCIFDIWNNIWLVYIESWSWNLVEFTQNFLFGWFSSRAQAIGKFITITIITMMIYRYNDDDYDDDSDDDYDDDDDVDDDDDRDDDDNNDDVDDDAGEAGKVLLKKLKSCFTSISNSINSLLFQVQLHLRPYSSQFNSKNISEVRS